MDRTANTAPEVDDASAETDAVSHTSIRSIAGLRPERERELARERRAAVADAELAASASKLLSPGDCVDGKYIICDVLGTGGSAVVYAAEQVGLRRVVAFKLYPVGGGLAPKLVARFEREAQLLARVHHENVVAVYDSGSLADGSPFLVVQRLQGDSLATRLLAGPLSVDEAVHLTRQVLSALSALSDAGITHRDVKPDNLVVDQLPDGSEVLKLVDFGVAQELHGERPAVPAELVGTPHYMAPEQVRGEEVDARCDLYALGATLYEMLTGRTPHAGESLQEIAVATLFGAITPLRVLRPDCPEGLERIVMRALARDAADRFASAREMLSTLDAWDAAQHPVLWPCAPLSPEAPLQAVPQAKPLEDTFRMSTRIPEAPIRRRRAGKVGFALAGALALGAVLVSQRLELRTLSPETSQVAASTLQVGQASAIELMFKVSSLASVLLVRTGASAVELATRARSSAQELFELAHRTAREWSSTVGDPARD